MKLRILSCAFLMLASCNSNKSLNVVKWERSSGLVQPDFSDVSLKSSKSLFSFKERISSQQQFYQGIPVENTFVKSIAKQNPKKNSKINEVHWIAAAVYDDQDMLRVLDISSVKIRQKNIHEELKQIYPPFRRQSPDSINPVIVQRNNKFEIQWKAIYTDKRGVPWEVRFSDTNKLLNTKRLGSQFHDAEAWVFPYGPKQSSLTEVRLSNIKATPVLANDLLWVDSQADKKIISGVESLKYSPEDTRFDQVQVFYFLSRSLEWFSKYVTFTLPTKLEAEVHIGAPDKTNAAFYYQNKIRLGAGDGRTYTNIPQDPSIVIHESVHAVIDAIAGLPFEGEGGSLNEGFADFFTALQIGSPHMGGVAYMKGPYRRTIENSVKLEDRTGALYHDSGIVSGTLWQLRQELGVENARDLAILTLNRMHYFSGFNDFGEELKKVAESHLKKKEDFHKALVIIENRGF